MTAAIPISSSPNGNAGSGRLHLAYLDGLRGLAAVYVMLFHALMEVNHCFRDHDLPRSVQRLTQLIMYGHSAVAVFIVLSGFCLMLPIMTSMPLETWGEIRRYLARRARRILPPYYAALLFSIVLVALMRPWQAQTDTFWDFALPAFTPGSLLSHLLLVHNLGPWGTKINPPMWSVGLEWQIYFLFPLILLPVYRRAGIVCAVGVAFLMGLGPYYLLPKPMNMQWEQLYYIGLFGLGMAAATVVFPRGNTVGALHSEKFWRAATWVFALTFLVLTRVHIHALEGVSWFSDVVVGALTTSLIIYCAYSKRDTARTASPLLLRLLEAPWMVKLGAFSYSLYLLHNPLQALLHLPMQAAGFSSTARLALLLTVGSALCILVAYGFHRVFERPFMSKSANGVKGIVRTRAAVDAPASVSS